MEQATWKIVLERLNLIVDEHTGKNGEIPVDKVHESLKAWGEKHPEVIDWNEWARNSIDRRDRRLRPDCDTPSMFGDDPDGEIPIGINKRIKLRRAKREHFVAWHTVELKNYSSQTEAFSRKTARITATLELFDKNPDCQTWAQLKKLDDEARAAAALKERVKQRTARRHSRVKAAR